MVWSIVCSNRTQIQSSSEFIFLPMPTLAEFPTLIRTRKEIGKPASVFCLLCQLGLLLKGQIVNCSVLVLLADQLRFAPAQGHAHF